MKRRSFSAPVKSALVALFLLSGALLSNAQDQLPTSTLEIGTKAGNTLVIDVEVAANTNDRAIGLMNRKSMPDNHGMLFVFPKARPVQMWMKDTLLPLDMLFIDESGRIVNIARNAKPMDETIISSGGSVSHVLEMNGGYAARHGISDGDTVSGPAMAMPAGQ
jgi:uncharacterized protein